MAGTILRDAGSDLQGGTVDTGTTDDDDTAVASNAVNIGCCGWARVEVTLNTLTGTNPQLVVGIYQSNTGASGEFELVGAIGPLDDGDDGGLIRSCDVYIDKPYVSYGCEFHGTITTANIGPITLQPKHTGDDDTGANATPTSS